ncbi:MAG TPA: hypothetical protein VIX91_22825 [Candidatus Acidoferrum sp.]
MAICSIALTLLVVSQILLIRDRELLVWTKIRTGIAVLVVLLLSVQWFRVTSGHPAVFRLQATGKTHTVTLTWKASRSKVAGYNVYRTTTRGYNYLRINNYIIYDIRYLDDTVISGETYFYVARAVDDRGYESVNSNETSAVIP